MYYDVKGLGFMLKRKGYRIIVRLNVVLWKLKDVNILREYLVFLYDLKRIIKGKFFEIDI